VETNTRTTSSKTLAHAQLSDFAFLDERHILVALQSGITETVDDQTTFAPSIQVYAFADPAGKQLPPVSTPRHIGGRYVGSLGLPRTHSSSLVLETMFHGNSLSTMRSPPCGGEVFRASERHRVFLVEMVIEAEYDAFQAVLCIPQHVLLRHILSMEESVPPLDVPWSAWGPEGSRLFFGRVVDDGWSCPAYGSRFAMSCALPTLSGEDAPGNLSLEIRVYDFSHLAVRRGLSLDGRPDAWIYESGPEDVNGSRFYCDVGDVSEYFIDSVSTKLPFRWQSKTWEQPLEEEGVHAVMLNEDNILLVSMEDVRGLALDFMAAYTHAIAPSLAS
jgi:hypothetical protein